MTWFLLLGVGAILALMCAPMLIAALIRMLSRGWEAERVLLATVTE